jgi:multiple sugar transport system permease protein
VTARSSVGLERGRAERRSARLRLPTFRPGRPGAAQNGPGRPPDGRSPAAQRGRPLRRDPSRYRQPRMKVADQLTAWGFLTPAVILILVFGVAPIVWSLVLSLQRNNLFSPNTPFVGLANYRQMVHDPIVAQAIEHTIVYTALFVPGTMIVGLFLAVAMNRKIRFINVYRTAAYATMAISTISEALVFIWLFDPSYGIVNYLFSKAGIPQQQFLNSPSEALYVIVIMTIWGWTGFAVVIYLAALQGIPKTLIEAAAIDGAGHWATFRRVTLPLLSPASLFLVVWLTINALQLFDEVWLSTQGGPLNSTTVLVYYLYQQAFGGANFNFGYASAIAYFLFIIIIVFTAIQFRAGRRLVHYRS